MVIGVAAVPPDEDELELLLEELAPAPTLEDEETLRAAVGGMT